MTAVDIIVRTKNRPKFLARALDDILAQELTDWHLIIVDNGDDPTETKALVDARGFGDRCTVLRQPEPVGVPALSNIGVNAGTAEFVTGPYRFEILENAGHWMIDTDQGEVTASILDHLASIQP